MIDDTTKTTPDGLVPPRRLGTLLARRRSVRGMTLDQVAEASDGRFSKAVLSSIERGTLDVDDEDLALLSEMYGIDTTSLIPERSHLEIDVDEGVLRSQIAVERFETDNPTADNVLSRYLGMVYAMRHAEPGSPVSLRHEDLEVLGTALHLGTTRVAADLNVLMAHPNRRVTATTQMLSRRVLIPAAGVLVAFCGVGALVLAAAGTGPDPATRPVTPESVVSSAPLVAESGVSSEVDIGAAVVQDRTDAGGAGAVQLRPATD